MAENIQEKSFEGQRDGEVVIKVFRRHMIAMRKGFYGLLIPLALSYCFCIDQSKIASNYTKGIFW